MSFENIANFFGNSCLLTKKPGLIEGNGYGKLGNDTIQCCLRKLLEE